MSRVKLLSTLCVQWHPPMLAFRRNTKILFFVTSCWWNKKTTFGCSCCRCSSVEVLIPIIYIYSGIFHFTTHTFCKVTQIVTSFCSSCRFSLHCMKQQQLLLFSAWEAGLPLSSPHAPRHHSQPLRCRAIKHAFRRPWELKDICASSFRLTIEHTVCR